MLVDTSRLIRIADLTDDEQAELDDLVLQWRQKRPRNNLPGTTSGARSTT
jgi:hypothetical protein